MRVPVLMHIQNFPHFPGELPYNTGYPQFDKVLRAYPKTNFVGPETCFGLTSAPTYQQTAVIHREQSSRED
jgi:hypothetical protein